MRMNKLYCAAVLALAAAFFLAPGVPVQAQTAPCSRAEAVIEVTTGRVLRARNENESLPVASTTKILTAIIIIEDCDLDARICIPEEAAGIEGSSIYLTAGEVLTVRDLLHGLMLRSGNDCAVALAVYHSGSTDKFAVVMNERARMIGASDFSFRNPHGLPQEGHFASALDMAKIAAYALRNKTFAAIVNSRRYVIADGGCGYDRLLTNKNKMLSLYEGADGVKTGYTKEAGRCLVSSATREGMHLVCTVLDSLDMYNRSAELLNECFMRYSMQELFDGKKYEREIPTDGTAGKKCRVSCSEQFFYPLAEGEEAFVEVRETLPDILILPVHKGDETGKIEVYLQNQLIFSEKIVSIMDVQKSYFDYLRDIMRGYQKKHADQQISCGVRHREPQGVR